MTYCPKRTSCRSSINQSSGTVNKPPTILCLACYFKGVEFLREAKRQGWRVLLITSKSLEHEKWPRESVDEFYYMPGEKDNWDNDTLIKGINYIARTERIARIVALDDFDVEKGALLREHLRVPGMGQTRARYFRDKLAMRTMAKEAGIPVPEFVGAFNIQEIKEFIERVPPPWVVKPRSQASATGIKKAHSADELWAIFEKLGERNADFLIEQFLPGHVYHVDALTVDSKIVFARAHRYMDPPMAVTHEGGIFRSYTLEYGSEEEQGLLKMNEDLMKAFGMRYSASHSEFIRAHADGKFYFLETSSRVGGANIAEMVEASSGLNLWAEWAKIETLKPGDKYKLPKIRKDYSGIIISLSRHEHPDLSPFSDPEVYWKMEQHHHVGVIVASKKQSKVTELLDKYAGIIQQDYHASAPAPDRPAH